MAQYRLRGKQVKLTCSSVEYLASYFSEGTNCMHTHTICTHTHIFLYMPAHTCIRTHTRARMHTHTHTWNKQKTRTMYQTVIRQVSLWNFKKRNWYGWEMFSLWPLLCHAGVGETTTSKSPCTHEQQGILRASWCTSVLLWPAAFFHTCIHTSDEVISVNEPWPTTSHLLSRHLGVADWVVALV